MYILTTSCCPSPGKYIPSLSSEPGEQNDACGPVSRACRVTERFPSMRSFFTHDRTRDHRSRFPLSQHSTRGPPLRPASDRGSKGVALIKYRHLFWVSTKPNGVVFSQKFSTSRRRHEKGYAYSEFVHHYIDGLHGCHASDNHGGSRDEGHYLPYPAREPV